MTSDRHTRIRKGVALAAAVALAAGASAQEVLPRLRQTPPIPAAPGAAPDVLGLRGSGAEQQPASASLRRARPRRTRPATVALVRVERASLIAPGTVREVQPALAGLPDPPVLVVSRRRRIIEADPYASLGLRVGGLTFFPAIQQDVGYDSNPNRLSGSAKSSLLSRTEGALRVQSDWLVHALNVELRGAYNAYASVPDANRPDADGRISLRLDATRDTQIDLESLFRLDSERPGSPELGVSVTERPLIARVGLAAGATHRFNRLSVGLRGSIERSTYEDARLTSGTVLDQSDRNVTTYGLRLRTAYELSPSLTPFVDLLIDTRVHDRAVDHTGFRRDSDGVGFRAGSTFEISRILTGEASAGYQVRRFEDARLRDLRGPILDAAVIYALTPLTTIRLRAAAETDDTRVVNSSGILARRATIEVQHDFRRNLSVTAALAFSQADYQGIVLREDIVTTSLRMDYRITRALALRASYAHERLTSTSPNSNYTADIVLLGVRYQP